MTMQDTSIAPARNNFAAADESGKKSIFKRLSRQQTGEDDGMAEPLSAAEAGMWVQFEPQYSCSLVLQRAAT